MPGRQVVRQRTLNPLFEGSNPSRAAKTSRSLLSPPPIKNLLKNFFGYDEFRPLQKEIIENILQKKDTFVLMPTGGGKSLCYQLPALTFEGITLVISPLIALMKDQVDSLKTSGISAEFLNSTLSAREIFEIQERIQRNDLKILYVAPERLALPEFQEILKSAKISLIAIDEAHCISEWGHDFRKEYRNLKVLKTSFPDVPIVALTATATTKVKDDIITQLHLENAKTFFSSFDRKNLTLRVTEKQKTFEKLLHLLKKYQNESVIIYCFSRKETEKIAADLQANGFNTLAYHAGLSAQERKENQEKFIRDEVQIMTATIAFGMGIDKPDIRLVVHYSFPKTLEGYYQEIGRAGRDGLPSECVMYFTLADKRKHDFFIDQMNDEEEVLQSREKLNQVITFAEWPLCKRKHLLAYFGEESPETSCDACDSCLSPKEQFDATIITQKILSAVIRTQNRFGKNYIINILLGKETPQILQNRHESLSVFGIVQDSSLKELSTIIQMLVSFGFLGKEMGKYPTLFVTEKGTEFLKQKQTITLSKTTKEPEGRTLRKKKGAIDFDPILFEELRSLRKKIADEQEVPPFVIFGNVSLQQMAYYFPINTEDFSKMSGVGAMKLQKFAEAFLQVINTYVTDKNITPKSPPSEYTSTSKRAAPSRSKSERYQQTKQMVEQKKSLEEMAQAQEFQKNTIVNHIERLLEAGETLDIEYLKPHKEKFDTITNAFKVCESEQLKPVFLYLKEEFSYDEIRLARLFLNTSF